MTPPANGAVEEGGKVAGDVVAGLKQSPVLLTLVVLNVVAILAAVWFLRTLAVNTHERTQWLLEHCIDGKPVPPS